MPEDILLRRQLKIAFFFNECQINIERRTVVRLISRTCVLFRFFYFFSLPRDLYSTRRKKKRFSCSLVTRQHMRARASVFVARWQAAVEPVGSISLLVEDSTVVVLCFAAKRKKNLTWHWASWSWKGMTSRWPSSKKRTQSSRTVSSLLLLCLSKWRRVTLELFCHRWKLILSTQQQPPRYFCSSVSPVPCKRTPQLPSGIRNTLSIVRGLFLSLDFIISINQFTHHVALVILEKINKNEWCMNGISQQVLKCRYYIYRIGSIVVVNK